MNTVFLNLGKIDFDKQLDLSPVTGITTMKAYEASHAAEILNRAQGQDIVITKELPVGRDLISQFPASVKLICEAGTGFNNIDLAAAKEKGIKVCNIPGYSSEAVAQLAVALMLNFSSSLSRQQVMIRQGNFTNFTEHLQVPHFELQNKTLGVIGSGAIGRQVIKVAIALGMKILAYNRTPKELDKVEFVELDELLKRSDFVTIHCPLTPATKYLINKNKLKLMKPSAFIINTSRGAIIKESDLIEALQHRQIAGAALDVQDPEPPAPDNPLWTMDNVILTPHIGWKCFESRQRLIQLIADNIAAFIAGNPIHVVN